jgi:hypothetical protein
MGEEARMALPAESGPGQVPEATREREHRRRVLKGASILSGINNSVVYCTIRNMHSNGAELIVPVEARVPSDFLLYVPADAISYRSTLRWRKLDRCGVSFSGTEPKPHWHYG